MEFFKIRDRNNTIQYMQKQNNTIYLKSVKFDFNKFIEIEIFDINEFNSVYLYSKRIPIVVGNVEEYNPFEKNGVNFQIGLIYVVDDYFICLNDQFCFKINKKGFYTIEDYLDAEKKGFQDFKNYYNKIAKDLKLVNYEEYFNICENGFFDPITKSPTETDQELLDMIKKIMGYRERNYDVKSIIIDVYNKAKQINYQTFKDLKKGFQLGYENGNDYYDSLGLGFINAKDYLSAKELDLANASIFYEIQEKGFTTKKEIEFYIWSEKYPTTLYKNYDELLLIHYLENLPIGKKNVSKIYQEYKAKLNELFGNKIKQDLQKNEVLYSVTVNNESDLQKNEMYSITINNERNLQDFLQKNDIVKHIGKYDVEGEYFEKLATLKKSEKKVYLDGSNIAYNSKEKPYTTNILIAVVALEKLGFSKENIIVIADKSLQHRIQDRDAFNQMTQESYYHESPAGTKADEFIINFAKTENAIIISNDRFSDYKENDIWVNLNIDRIRIPFSVINENVQFGENIKHFI